MQFRINLKAGVKMRQEFTGTTFVLAEIGIAKMIDLSIEIVGFSQEEIRGVKKGLNVKTSSSFTGATFFSLEDTTIEVIVSRNDLQINYLDGSLINANVINTVQIKNDGNPLYIAENKRAQIVLNNGPFDIDENLAVVMAANWQRTSYRVRNIGTSDIAIGGAGLTWDKRAIIIHPGDFYIEVDAARMPIYILSAPGEQSVCNIQTVENIGVEVLLPTVAPTAAPTVAPTVAPTAAPTVAPTVAPTTAPTVAPVANDPLKTAALFSIFGANVTGTMNNTDNLFVGGLSAGLVGTPFGSALHFNDATAQQAATDLTAAIDYYSGLVATGTISGDMIGRTVTPGIYTAGAAIGNTGILTLDGMGDPNAKFIFICSAAVGTAALSMIRLINGATSDNVIWVCTGAVTLGAGSSFAGSILGRAGIGMADSVILKGRALSLNNVVIANTITSSNQPPITSNPLKTAALFSVFGASVSGTLNSTANLFVGGLSAGLVGTPFGSALHFNDATAQQAAIDLSMAIDYYAGLPKNAMTIGDMIGQTIHAGVHETSTFANTGIVTLDALGDPNAEFIFVAGDAVGTAALSEIRLINGATAKNVIWVCTGAVTLGAGSTFVGTILGRAAIGLGAGVKLNGRILSKTAIVMAGNNIVS